MLSLAALIGLIWQFDQTKFVMTVLSIMTIGHYMIYELQKERQRIQEELEKKAKEIALKWASKEYNDVKINEIKN